ncbi:unnamed protein product [Dovyalis caffra]|uniref:Uncharacterized protein n=1 Tax=Dovyalis caffra TaxID=77055 RepID=A0AAV1RWC0_9ROSI|nr:unnamed protein product [Dovyalis caffra]
MVTSTLAVCTDPYPQVLEKPDESDKASEELQVQSGSTQNGVEPVVGDGDEIMTEVEEADIDDDMTIDMEALEEITFLLELGWNSHIVEPNHNFMHEPEDSGVGEIFRAFCFSELLFVWSFSSGTDTCVMVMPPIKADVVPSSFVLFVLSFCLHFYCMMLVCFLVFYGIRVSMIPPDMEDCALLL